MTPLNFAADIKGIKRLTAGNEKRKRKREMESAEKRFIAWDGEGAKSLSERAQSYVLLGCSTGDKIISESLRTRDCFEFMLQIATENPNCIHAGFAFDYDVNMILKDLTPKHFATLKEIGRVKWNQYTIEHVPGKWFTVTRNHPIRQSIKISEAWGFFQSSFVKAIKSYIPTHPLMAELAVIEEGKGERNNFTFEKIDYITKYWEIEIQLLEALLDQLREYMYDAGFPITSWHGPGAIANYVYKTQGIADHKTISPQPVRDAAAFAYAGGRFELFRMGRAVGDVYSLDINSAYPNAIAQLPSLAEGHWEHVYFPDTIEEFGVYRVEMDFPPAPYRKAGPVFHRDKKGNVSFPWQTKGWYWSPEVKHIFRQSDSKIRVLEGWVFVGWETRPFSEFVPQFYNARRELKAAKIGSEKALKLALNSLYGKMAQRVGWERNNEPPKWHQLEWAGWVTSMTRAMLYDVMLAIPREQLIAVETDGIYTTCNPATIGITDSTDLGGWEINEYAEIMYVQSGVYFIRDREDKWTGKYRGLDAGSLSDESMAGYLQTLAPNPSPDNPWPRISGPTTRFHGYRSSLHRQGAFEGGMKQFHRVWETSTREISPGDIGKRRHLSPWCSACREEMSGYDGLHDLVINSAAILDPESQKHDIPWEYREETRQWREHVSRTEDLISL